MVEVKGQRAPHQDQRHPPECDGGGAARGGEAALIDGVSEASGAGEFSSALLPRG